MAEPRALIVDDDTDFRESLELLVQRERFATRSARSLEDARKELAAGPFDVVLMDLGLPDGDGLAWLREHEVRAGTEVIVITGSTSVEAAIGALRAGALDYLTKPIDRARLSTALLNVARTKELKAQVGSLRGELRDLGRFGAMVGRSKAMLDIYDLVARVAPTDATVLITGESGTGKELVAQTIHALSARKAQVLLPVNCGAVSPTLIESELFGHERGSFTGADKQRKGYFERANGGTLFLDEVSEMPLDLQVKLLRVLETGAIVRVGGSEPISVDVRVVAATNRNPVEAVKDGQLREDLYYRLNVFPIHLPPLRGRPEDIELLADYFLSELNRAAESRKRWSRAALQRLSQSPWTGNVRELKNVVQRAFILGNEEIGAETLPLTAAASARPTEASSIQVAIGSTISDAECALILATLHALGDDKKKTAETLGVSLKTLYNRLNVYAARGDLKRDGAAAPAPPAPVATAPADPNLPDATDRAARPTG
jgi:DNA-binding NtrC family response regulator